MRGSTLIAVMNQRPLFYSVMPYAKWFHLRRGLPAFQPTGKLSVNSPNDATCLYNHYPTTLRAFCQPFFWCFFNKKRLFLHNIYLKKTSSPRQFHQNNTPAVRRPKEFPLREIPLPSIGYGKADGNLRHKLCRL